MSQDDWLSLLRSQIPEASPRKNSLYFCAGLRHLWDWVYDHRSRTAVEVTERFVDGLATEEQRAHAEYYAEIPTWGYGDSRRSELEMTARVNRLVDEESLTDVADFLFQELIDSGLLPKRLFQDIKRINSQAILDQLTRLAQIAEFTSAISDERCQSMLSAANQIPNWPGSWLIREIYGNQTPVTPIDPDWLAWDAGTVRAIAQGVYEERAFDRLPILADALQDAGCDEEEVLAHLRSSQEHYLGCWALDWVLGKS